MTSPTNVGQVSVEVLADAKKLARSLKSEVEGAFKDIDVAKLIHSSLGNEKIKLPVEVDPDTEGIPEKVKKTRVPKVPVEVDPLMKAFQDEVRRQTQSLARTVNTEIPVGADTSRLREELAAQLAAVAKQARLEVPTEPGARAEYEAKLKAELAAVAASVKQHVKVEPDTKSAGGFLSEFGKALPSIPGISGVLGTVSELVGGLSKVASVSQEAGGGLAGLAAAAGPIGAVSGTLVGVIAMLGGIGAAAIAAIPAVTALAGAVAAIPGALAGLGAGFGTLTLGFKGIGDAFKPKPKGGGGGGGGGGQNQAARARQVTAAERGVESARRGVTAATRGVEAAERNLTQAEQRVTEAQKRAQATQKAINLARKEAAEDIDDLNRSLRGAVLSEEDAALSVEEALRALNEAKVTGNLPDIKRADLAYRQSLQTLDEAKDTTGDLQQATDEANKKGVEGSDKVQAALADQHDALRAVVDAQGSVRDAQDGVLSANDSLKSSYDGLASAQDALAASQEKVAAGAAGAAAAAAAVTKLAPAAQKFVAAVKALKPAFENLRLDVQQRLFEGLDKTVTRIGEKWIPALKTTLGQYADTFNGFFKNLGAAITTPKFIKDLQTGAEGARQGFAAIGKSITTSLVPAFGSLSKASAPFLKALGKEIASIVTDFSNWILQGEKTKGLEHFFDKAVKALHEIRRTGKIAGSIIGSLFEIITGAQKTKGKTQLDSLNDSLQTLADWLKDPANQQKIRDFVHDIGDLTLALITVVGWFTSFKRTVDGIKNTDLGFGNIGTEIMHGLKTGLSAINPVGMIWDLCHTIITLVKQLFGIHSPSTVFAAIGRDLVLGLINGIGAKIGQAGQRALALGNAVINVFRNAGNWLYNHGRNIVTGLIRGVAALAAAAANRAVSVGNGIVGVFRNAGSWLYNHGRNIVVGLINGIASLANNAANRAVSIANSVIGVFRNAGSWLYNHGRAIISGLINGISSKLGSLGSFLGGVGSFIQAHKGPIDKDRLLLVGAGQAIMGGLIGGIGSRKQDLAAELADVTALMQGVSGTTLADDLGSVSARLERTSALTAQWAPGTTGDPLLDAIRRMVKFGWSGDVQAALGAS